MKITLAASIFNPKPLTVNKSDKSITNGTITLNSEDMSAIKEAYRGSNRVFKPIHLLFYTDVFNSSLPKLKEIYGEANITIEN